MKSSSIRHHPVKALLDINSSSKLLTVTAIMRLKNETTANSKKAKNVFAKPLAAKTGQEGMTIVEILIVIALMGTIMAIITGKIVDVAKDATVDATKMQIEKIESSMQMFYIKNRRYPSNEEGLQILVTDSAGKSYLEESKLVDPWGIELQYLRKGRKYSITSAGPDLEFDTEDDISRDYST